MAFSFEPLVACALTLSCFGAPATSPESTFTLTKQGTDGVMATTTLNCTPPMGTHPHPAEACISVTRADGDFENLPDKNQACAMVYAPVAATARGTWRGEPVDFSTTFPNDCIADARSGGVFGF